MNAALAAAPSFDVDYPASQAHMPFIIVGAFVGIAVLVGVVCLLIPERRDDAGLPFLAAFVIAFIGSIAAGMAASSIDNDARSDAEANHVTAVTEWLSDTYGIAANESVVEDLLSNETAAVNRNGQLISVTLTPNTDGTITVFDTVAGEPLKQVTR